MSRPEFPTDACLQRISRPKKRKIWDGLECEDNNHGSPKFRPSEERWQAYATASNARFKARVDAILRV